MKSLRQEIQKSWFPQMSLISGDLAASLGLSRPLSLAELTRHLDQPETLSLGAPLDADALHGAVELILRSDGTYTFRGHLRATGFPSFEYTVQVFVRSVGDAVLVAMQTSGRVFGTDTPGGDRSKSWDESGSSPFIRDYWTALRQGARLETNLDKSLSGFSGGLVDIAKTVFETFLAAQTGGIIGAVIVLGSELGSATGQTFINPNILAGVTVGAGILLVFGPGAIIPAVAAGTTTALLANIRHRPMNDREITLAQKVFKDQLPLDRIRLTDLFRPGDNGIDREFVLPGIDGSILVNMGKNLDHTLEADVQGRPEYSQPGEVLIHELTHAWQVHHTSFMPGLLCKGVFGSDYRYDLAEVTEHKPWSEFGLEAQAHIIEDWFGLHTPRSVGGALDPGIIDLDSREALADPRFLYVSQNIRLGRA
jgi:hypothetical protein